MVEIRYYIGSNGAEPFADWFAELDPAAGAKVARAIARIEQGNFSNVKGVEKVCWNTRSISGRATESILGEMAMRP